MKDQPIKLSFLVLAIISLIYLEGYSQSRGLKYRQVSSIDVVIGGDFGFRLISGDTDNPEIFQKIENRKKEERHRTNYRFGFNYYHAISSRFLIKTGLRIANPGFSTSPINEIDISQDINSIKKVYYQQGPDYRYKYQLIEIPFGFKYAISRSFCNPYLEFGVASNFYLQTTVDKRVTERGFGRSTIHEEINRINFISFLATGGDFRISNNVSGFSQLVARYQLNNLRQGELVEKIISVGMELGVRYHI